jgi:hypothetical protein
MSVQPPGVPAMDLGDIVIYGGQRFYVRGVDPGGVHPRYLYLENVRTGKTVAVAFEQHTAATARSPGRLRLLRKRADKSSTHGSPVEEAQEPDPNP